MQFLHLNVIVQIVNELVKERGVVSKKLKWLSHVPHLEVIKYHVYLNNKVHNNTKERDNNRSIQTSGVSLVASTTQISSAKDKNLIFEYMSFYEMIQEI